MRRRLPLAKFHGCPPVRQQRGRIGWFLIVGCSAAAVHWSVVVAIVHLLGWRPLTANVVGWMVAFSVSFAGHHRLSFRDHGSSIRSSALRFFAVSAAGFMINEASYAWLLSGNEQHFGLLLAAVLAGVAVITYVLSRHWAFIGSPARD
ncbi:MAG: GtrA family protein [Ideonella sp.]